MASYPDLERIEDEDMLETLINETDDIELRRRIRKRQTAIREKRLAAYEAERQARFQSVTPEDAVTLKLRRAQEEKQRKLRIYEQKAKEHSAEIGVAEEARRLRLAKADEEKQKKLDTFREMGRYASSLYNAGVNDLLSSKNQENDVNVNSLNFLTIDPKASKAVLGFGGTSYAAKSAPALQRQDSANKNAITRDPTSIKQLLLDWAKAQVGGYQNVNVTNFSTSWNDGMAFCALIHHFYPDAFDFNKLNPKNRRGNFALAFSTAERLAGLDPLLDVEDMVRMKSPDWKCVFTYVQTFYRRFATQGH